MKPSQYDRERRLREIVRETIAEFLQPGNRQFEEILAIKIRKIIDRELRRIISQDIQNSIGEIVPDLEKIIYERLLSDPYIRDYLLPSEISMPKVIMTGDPKSGKNLIMNRMAKAQALTICDPYFFNHSYQNEENYIEDIISILPSEHLQNLIIFCRRPRSSTIIRKFKKRIPSNVQCQVYEVNDIHDRVWIKDSNKGLVVGTSFGGIGKKVTFILNLPKKDLIDFMEMLEKIRSENRQIN